MRIERASSAAVKYAILTWHYSKSVPMVQVAYSVFNDAGEWCGVICYSMGASMNIADPFGLSQGQVIELVRVALNGKQESTSRALAMTLRSIPKDAPLVKLIVSYADSSQGHVGTIYQATNWIFSGDSFDAHLLIDNKQVHRKSAYNRYGSSGIKKLQSKGIDVKVVNGLAKHKYLFPLSKDMKKFCETLRKPYPKKAIVPESTVKAP